MGTSQPPRSLSAKQRLVMKDRASCADNPEVVCVSSANGNFGEHLPMTLARPSQTRSTSIRFRLGPPPRRCLHQSPNAA